MSITVDDLIATPLRGAPSGIDLIEVTGPAPLAGIVCRIDLRHYAFRVFCFQDLIDKPMFPESMAGPNLGCSIQAFVDAHPNCLIASNTLQTNFISSKGFVVDDGRLISKPLLACGRGDPEYVTYGIAGDYTCLVVEGSTARVVAVSVDDATGTKTNPAFAPGGFGIASPRLVEPTASGPRVVEIECRNEPFRDGPSRRLNGDCVDWGPKSTATSFTAFGVAANERGEDTILVMASIFAGEWGVDVDDNAGVLPEVMGQVMIRDGKAHAAILGGGSADTQQFVRWRDPKIRIAPVRKKSAAMSRGEVIGVRGLGAIAAVFARCDT